MAPVIAKTPVTTKFIVAHKGVEPYQPTLEESAPVPQDEPCLITLLQIFTLSNGMELAGIEPVKQTQSFDLKFTHPL